jgi:hypothetical protein
VDVPKGGATRLEVEARWTCDDPQACQMEMNVHNGTGDSHGTAIGNGTARVVVQAPHEGVWGVSMLARQQGVVARGNITLTVVR